MSNPFDDLPASPADRLRVGDYLVDVLLREVQLAGTKRSRRITPKAMGVLLVLADNAGKVVSRDALLGEVWPGTLPTNDVVTQAITSLRKAFGEERGNPRYIETIAKTGYRLMAPVTWPREPLTNASAAPASALGEGVRKSERIASVPAPVARPRSLREIAVVAGVVFALLLGLALFSLLRDGGPLKPSSEASQAQPAGTDRPYRLITSSPGFEFAPTLSPDAAMIAYSASLPDRRGTAIMVQTTDQARARQLTQPAVGVTDRIPAWSPDGREIAFQRTGPGSECQVLVKPVNGGASRYVGRCIFGDTLSFSWTPDGRGLIFGSMATALGRVGMRVLDLASGQWRPLSYASTPNDVDFSPRYSPDGHWIVFVRNPQLGDLWRIPADGGTPEALTGQSVEMRGWDWLPDGRGLVFSRRVDSETRLYRLDLDTRELRDLGIEDAQSPTVAARAPMMAFVNRRAKFGLFRFERVPAGSDHSGKARPEVQEQLFASSGRDGQPSVAPDARQLLFNSDRSGRYSLWWADLQRPDSLRLLEGVRPETRRLPEWSWDSRAALVAGTDDDGRYGLYEVKPASGQVAMLPVPVEHPIQGVYLPDSGRLLVGAGSGAGQVRLTLFDRSQVPWRALATIDDVSLAKVDPARKRVLFTRLSGNGLWQADLDLTPASVRQIDASAPARWRYRTWDVASDGNIYYLESLPDCMSSLRLIATAQPPPARCLQPDRLASTNGFSVSGRANAIFVPMATEDGSDIGFMPLPTAPGGSVPRWFK